VGGWEEAGADEKGTQPGSAKEKEMGAGKFVQISSQGQKDRSGGKQSYLRPKNRLQRGRKQAMGIGDWSSMELQTVKGGGGGGAGQGKYRVDESEMGGTNGSCGGWNFHRGNKRGNVIFERPSTSHEKRQQPPDERQSEARGAGRECAQNGNRGWPGGAASHKRIISGQTSRQEST